MIVTWLILLILKDREYYTIYIREISDNKNELKILLKILAGGITWSLDE